VAVGFWRKWKVAGVPNESYFEPAAPVAEGDGLAPPGVGCV